MSAADALQVFGSTIECRYPHPSGSGYTTGHFTYSGLHTAPFTIRSTSGFSYTGGTFLEYTADFTNVSSSPDYITVDIQPVYSIFNTTQIHTAILLSNVGYVNLQAYDSPFWDWVYDGSSYHLEETGEEVSGNNILGYVSSDGVNYNYVCADFSSQHTTSGYSYRAGFSGVQPNSGYGFKLLIGLPYVSSGSTGTNGTYTVTTGGGSGSGSSVDMGPTNTILEEQTGILQQIKQGIQGFFDTIKNALLALFVPSSDFMDEFKDDMQDLLEDHLGGLYQAISKIDDIFTGFSTVTTKQSIHINAVNIPLAGETLTLGNWDVPLKRNELSILYDGIAFIIDFLATAAFLNMCRNKLEIFLNPDSEVITE